MSFENLGLNAIRGQKKIVIRQLMDVGLLNSRQYCAKDHDRKRMILEENQKQWWFLWNIIASPCWPFQLSDIRNVKPEMILAFPLLHSKVKRNSVIKVGFMWTDFISPFHTSPLVSWLLEESFWLVFTCIEHIKFSEFLIYFFVI